MNKTKYAFRTPAIAMALLFVLSACDMGYERNMQVKVLVDTKPPVITVNPVSVGVNVGEPAALTVAGELSDGVEGTLQYQWYRYLTYRAYQEQGGILIAGAVEETYNVPTDADGEFNYYAVVTNFFQEASGRKTASVKSGPATVTVNDPRNAKFPVITEHPDGGEPLNWRPGIILPTLTVEVEEFPQAVSDEIRFQWFVTNVSTNLFGTPIGGAVTNTLVPPVALPGQEAQSGLINGAGDYYYFCVVTNFFFNAPGRRESSIASNPALVSISASIDAEAPVITVQPVSAQYFVNESVNALTVKVNDVEDGGTISYQWYSANSNTVSSAEEGTKIAGAVSPTFSPAISNSTTGRYFYYAVVTNTNEYVTNKEAKVASRVAEVVISSPATGTANATFTVQFGGANQHQFVRGFGGMDVAWGNFPNYTVEDYENMYNPDKLGYNMLRIMILPTYTDINRTLLELINNRIYTTMFRGRFYDNVKTVNNYGGYVLASPWSPPAAWKTNNSINGGGELRESDYQNYANYLRAFAQNMLNNGAPVYAVSIQNEPNYPAGYDGCEWSSTQMRNFYRDMGKFTEGVAGYGGGKVIPSVKTMNGESANATSIHEGVMTNPRAREAVDILARHNYGSRNENGAGTGNIPTHNWIYRATEPKEMWMTEHNLNSNSGTSYPNDHTWNYIWVFMNDVDMSIRINHEAAFIWWSAKRFYSMIGDGTYGTIGGLNSSDVTTGELLPRGWGLAHYSKFAKESYRVGVSYSGQTAGGAALVEGTNINGSTYANFESTTVKVSAYMKLKGGEVYPVNWRDQEVPISDITEITMVMFTPTDFGGSNGYDMGRVRLQLPAGFRIASATAMRSDPTIFHRGTTERGTPEWETVNITADRNAAIVSLPVSTILSVRFTQ